MEEPVSSVKPKDSPLVSDMSRTTPPTGMFAKTTTGAPVWSSTVTVAKSPEAGKEAVETPQVDVGVVVVVDVPVDEPVIR